MFEALMNRVRILETKVWLPRPRCEVFEFFHRAENLQRITPPWLDFQILTPRPIPMGEGTIIDYRLRLRGLPLRWRTQITRWDPPHSFVDTQIEGPFKTWVHTHRFKERDGGTRMQDRVEYVTPGGALSPLIDLLLVLPEVTGIFEYRKRAMKRLFGASELAEEVAHV